MFSGLDLEWRRLKIQKIKKSVRDKYFASNHRYSNLNKDIPYLFVLTC